MTVDWFVVAILALAVVSATAGYMWRALTETHQ